MLWQPDLKVFAQMVNELNEFNHPSHCVGNGPEQDYLSRFWADAPWSHIGSEYNYQMHQMFLSLHANKRDGAERVKLLLKGPESVKVIHYSGDESAKPWQRLLDTEQAEKYWPARSKDAEYLQSFAENFQGYHIWVKRDREWLETSKLWSSHRWELADFTLDEKGDMYKASTDGGKSTCVNLPDDISNGVMSLLSNSLTQWFDAYQELEKTLGIDLRQSLLATMATINAEKAAAKARETATSSTWSTDAAKGAGAAEADSRGCGCNGSGKDQNGFPCLCTWTDPKFKAPTAEPASIPGEATAQAQTACGSPVVPRRISTKRSAEDLAETPTSVDDVNASPVVGRRISGKRSAEDLTASEANLKI